MSEVFLSEPYRETVGDRVASLKFNLDKIKQYIGELEGDIEKCDKKHWLDAQTLKRLDKAVTVMKVGYKIGKRGMNRDKKHGDSESRDDPPVTESDAAEAQSALSDALADRTT